MNESILPADTYVVVNKSVISLEDKKIVNMLYLPIIGSLPVTLYEFLINDLDRMSIMSTECEHAHVLTSLHISATEFVEARNALEAIGLVKTYIKKDSVNNYIYELYSPVSVHEFFNHPIFNIVLYNNIGKKEYDKLLAYFKIPKINKDGYKEITHTFNQIYESIPYTSYDLGAENIRKYNKLKLNIDSNFDMNFLIETMPNQIDKKIFTKDLQELILSLAYLYDIDAPRMQNIIKSVINEKGIVNRDELRKVARDHYQFDHNGVLPTVIEHTQPEYLRKPIGDNSPMAKMIYTFETVSPYDFLKSKHNGAEPVKRDMKLVEDLIIDYKLKPGVVNVLIDFVLKTNDNKLTRTLVETIAGQWSRKKIETVEAAMEIAKKNYRSSLKISSTVQAKAPSVKNVPVWFNENITTEAATLEEQEEIDKLLRSI